MIYELHVGGFTRHPNSGLEPGKRGTYAGLIEKIPYLKDLGVTAVELLPVFQFDVEDAPAGLTNYWGYSPVSFFAPHGGYSVRRRPARRPGRVPRHGQGAAPGRHRGDPRRGLQPHGRGRRRRADALLPRARRLDLLHARRRTARYANYSGCGNTLNANHPVVRRLILDSLRYWVEEMHVDGFRFDLASILSRDETGEPMANPPDPVGHRDRPGLAGTKLIAEAWDAAGLYQVGTLRRRHAGRSGTGRFRDDVRGFVRGDPGTVDRARRPPGRQPRHLRHEQPREPEQSINFVTCHDGFTLNDLVSYDHKHNEANGEDNRDGIDDNLSWNCGVEGPTDDPAIEALRKRQIKNFLAITILSLGTPMLLMGDEMRRTQRGNNNAYCQDNEMSWFDWDAVEDHTDLIRFMRLLIQIRFLRESVQTEHHLTLGELAERAQIQLHGVTPGQPDLSFQSRSLALSASNLSGDPLMYFALNAYWEPLEFRLPDVPAWATSGWRRVLDTSLLPPDDIVLPTEAPQVNTSTYQVGPRSVVVMFATRVG